MKTLRQAFRNAQDIRILHMRLITMDEKLDKIISNMPKYAIESQLIIEACPSAPPADCKK